MFSLLIRQNAAMVPLVHGTPPRLERPSSVSHPKGFALYGSVRHPAAAICTGSLLPICCRKRYIAALHCIWSVGAAPRSPQGDIA